MLHVYNPSADETDPWGFLISQSTLDYLASSRPVRDHPFFFFKKKKKKRMRKKRREGGEGGQFLRNES